MIRLPDARLPRRHVDPATGLPCGRSRLDHLAERRRRSRSVLVAAPALALVGVFVLQSRTFAWAVGAMLGYCLVMAAAWALAAWFRRWWRLLGGHVRAANRRAGEVPEPPSNVHVTDRPDDPA